MLLYEIKDVDATRVTGRRDVVTDVIFVHDTKLHKLFEVTLNGMKLVLDG